MKLDTSIFKAYDIRGIYPTSLNEEIAYKVGRAYAQILKEENPNKKLEIAVTNDVRLSTPQLKKNLLKGLIDSEINVSDYDLSTTPTFYFTVSYYKYDGGIQISASHNPKEYNGFKIVRRKAYPVGGETGIYKIRDIIIENNFKPIKEKGNITKKESVVKIAKEILRKGINWKKIKPFKIVVDTANAMGILDIETIFEDLPCKLIKLNSKLDGNFPAHQPDPLQDKNLEPSKKEILKQKADLGIVPDGDGDRYFFIDEKGKTFRQDILRGIMAQIVLKKNPGAKICYDIRPGKITEDMILEAGGIPIVTKVGHSLIKEKMIEEGAVFAGESSGHYYYKFNFGSFDAPIRLVYQFLAFISEENKPLSEISKPYEKYHQSGEINFEVDDKEEKMKEIVEKYSDGKISFLDGITIEYKDFWFNVRPSNTEPLLRLNLEASSREKMEEERGKLIKLINL